MRKLKNWLLTAGIAAVMATGVAVGAHLTTNDAPLRTEAAANVTETTIDFSSASLTTSNYNNFTNKGFKIESTAADYESGYIKYNQDQTINITSVEKASIISVEFFGASGKNSPERFQGPNKSWTRAGKKLTYSGTSDVSSVLFTAGSGKQMKVNKLIIGTKVTVDPNAFSISSDSDKVNFDLANPVAATITVTPTNGAGAITYSVVDGYNTNIVTVTNKENVFTFAPGTAPGTTNVTLKANDTAADATLNIAVTSAMKYTKVTDLSKLKYGDELIIGDNSSVFGTLENGHYLPAEIKVSGNEANVISNATAFILEPGLQPGSKAFKNIATNNYLSASEKNLVEVSIKDSSCDWSVAESQSNIEIKNIVSKQEYNNIISWHTGSHYFNLYKNCNGITLYKNNSNSYISSLQEWIDTCMEMKNPNFEGDGTGECRNIYWDAKSMLVDLDKKNDGTMELFQSESTFAAAKLRYTKWAEANGDATPFGNNIKPSNVSIFDSNNNVSLIVIISVSVLSITGIAIFAITRRKKLAK